MHEILLTDLIDVQVLQRIQNGFSRFTGMASLTTDANGNPVTEGSGFTDFCMKYTRTTEKGLARCIECDKKSGLLALERGKSVVYNCHAGLVDYAAPIMVEEQYLGSFLGGQVRTAPVVEEEVRNTARDLGIDEEEYLEAIYKTKQITYEQVEQAAEFLSEIAAVLSEMAYKSYVALQQSQQLERAARSHNDFIVEMNVSMRQRVQEWIDLAQEMLEEEQQDNISERLENLMEKGREFMTTIDDTVEYSKITGGEIELNEKEYNIRDVIKSVRHSYKSEAREKGNEIKLEFAEDLPVVLLGDAGRIRQVVCRFVRSCIRNTENGEIIIRVYGSKKSYATKTVIEVADTGKGLSESELMVMREFFTDWSTREAGVGNTVLPILLAEMSGTVEVDSVQGEGTVYRISIPQLAVESDR
ncbi:MAG: hypothetical protein E7292_01820 [Lachnospiraceae bacterium]|nr:hypothetical protein [Lachnospiraceae bacterium]